jgi:uncharacterized protein (TIGR02001 family)
MKMNTKLRPLVIATSLALTGIAAPMVSHAETSASVAVSNMYLWRGTNLSQDGGVVSGSIDYTNSGFYAGIWGSSETDGSETDLYLGYGGSVGDFTYDISYAWYLYPEDAADLTDSDGAELILKLGYGPAKLGIYQQMDSDLNDDTYYALSGNFGKVTATYGWWDLEVPGDEYNHITVDFAATDELTFSFSKANSDTGNTAIEDPLFAVTWKKLFEL